MSPTRVGAWVTKGVMRGQVVEIKDTKVKVRWTSRVATWCDSLTLKPSKK